MAQWLVFLPHCAGTVGVSRLKLLTVVHDRLTNEMLQYFPVSFVWFCFSIELHQPVVLLCIALHLHMTRSSRCANDRVTGCKYCCRVSSLQTCFGGEVETMERKLFMCNIIQIEVCGGFFFLGGGQKSMQI